MSSIPLPRIDERQRWTASAEAWGRWADPLAEPADRINRPLVEAAAVGAGHYVLDIATGTGEPALSLTERIGDRGLVIGCDIVPAMLAHAARRAAARAAALPLAAADMQSLPFPNLTFDRATCRFGVMFVPDADMAAREMLRVLKPGGRVALAVWGPYAGNTLFREIETTVNAVLGADPDGTLRPLFRFAEPGSLAAILRAAGFRDPLERDVVLDQRVALDRPFWVPTLEMGFALRLRGLAAEVRAELDAALRHRFAGLAEADGCVPIRMDFRIVAATRPD